MRSAATALLVSLCACACGDRSSPVGGAIPRAEAGGGAAAAAVPIENFAQVDDGLYRGAQPGEVGFRALRDLGVKTVISFRRFHDNDREDVPASIGLVEIPLEALVDSDPPTDEELAAFFDVVLDPARRPVFVHCAHGKDRTGTMCAVYRMEVQGWTPEKAFEEMQSYGFHDIYTDLERYVKGYEPRFADRVRALAVPK